MLRDRHEFMKKDDSEVLLIKNSIPMTTKYTIQELYGLSAQEKKEVYFPLILTKD